MRKLKEVANYLLSQILEKESLEKLDLEEKEEAVILKIKVKPESIGRLIGRGGKIIKALRNLLKIVAFKKTGKKLFVEVVKD